MFRLGSFTLYSYGLMLALAFVVATWLAGRAAREIPPGGGGRLPPRLVSINPVQIVDFCCLSLLGGILGARLFYVILHSDEFAHAPQHILAIWHGGLVWYGGFAGGLLAGWLYLRTQRLPFLRVVDQLIPFLVFGHAIGRLGCFLNGCCYGAPSDAWCAVTFPGHPEAVWPTQLFEAAALLALFVILRRLQRPAVMASPGRLLGVYLVSYATLRFFLEFLRGDQATWWAGLTLQQLISLGVAAAGLWLLRRNRVRPRHGLHRV